MPLPLVRQPLRPLIRSNINIGGNGSRVTKVRTARRADIEIFVIETGTPFTHARGLPGTAPRAKASIARGTISAPLSKAPEIK